MWDRLRTRCYQRGAALASLSLSARAGCHCVVVGFELFTQLPARVTQLSKLRFLSPLGHRLLALKSPKRDKPPGVCGVPKQHVGLGSGYVIQRPLCKGRPALDELILASWVHQPSARGVRLFYL